MCPASKVTICGTGAAFEAETSARRRRERVREEEEREEEAAAAAADNGMLPRTPGATVMDAASPSPPPTINQQ